MLGTSTWRAPPPGAPAARPDDDDVKELSARVTGYMVYTNMLYVNVDQLLADCGGKLTFDSACSRSVGGVDWYRDLAARLMKNGLRPIEYPEAQPFRFGASKVVKSTFGAIIPCCVRGVSFAVRVSVVPCKVPGLLSRKAQDELDVVYRARQNTADLKEIGLTAVPMGLSSAGHPTLDILDFDGKQYRPPSDVSDTTREIRIDSNDVCGESAGLDSPKDEWSYKGR